MKTLNYILVLIIVFPVMGCSGKGSGGSGDLRQGLMDEVDHGLAGISFDHTEYDFGQIYEGEKVGCIFTYENTGDANLIIRNASGSCGCTVPRWDKEPTPPGKTGKLEVIFDSSGRSGEQNKTVTVTSNTSNKVTILYIKAEVTKPES